MHDLATLGEVLLRLSVPSPARFETVRQLDLQLGGAEANVAAVCARLGLRTAWISALPRNPWGERIRRELTAHGVDCGAVRYVERARVGLYFMEYGVAPRPIQVLYDRADSAFARLDPDDVDWKVVREARMVHLTGITPALGERPRALVRRALREASSVSFDLNYRATLWSAEEAARFLDEVLPVVRYLFLGEEEARWVLSLDGAPEAALEALAARAPKATVTMLRGAEGAVTLDGGRFVRPARQYRVDVVDPIGAGDAYVGGFLWARLQDRPLEEAVEIANAIAALKCATWGDIALVSVRDVEELMAGGPAVRR